MIRLVVLGLVCAVFAEKREFVPSASMDTEGGWRVIENPIISYNGLSENEPSVYLSFPKLERLSSDVVGSDFLNNDEEFRIKVLDSQEEARAALLRADDSFPESSSSYITTSQEEPLEFLSPLRLIQPPPNFKDETSKSQKFPSFSSSDFKSFTKPRKLIPDRFPPSFYDSIPEMTNVKNFQQYLTQSDDEYEYIAVPKGSYRKLPKIVEEKPQLYEIDKNARPIILSEEIRYEGLPPQFMSPRFPPMPMKMNFPGGPNMIHRSPPPRSYFKPMPPKRSSIKMKRVVNNSDSLKRAMRSYRGGSPSKGIPLIRGRFQV